jgi:hypothetical protein
MRFPLTGLHFSTPCRNLAHRDIWLQRLLEAHGLTTIPNDGRTRKDFVDCQARTPNVLEYKQWVVDLEFDADGHLSDAGVAIWNIFL